MADRGFITGFDYRAMFARIVPPGFNAGETLEGLAGELPLARQIAFDRAMRPIQPGDRAALIGLVHPTAFTRPLPVRTVTDEWPPEVHRMVSIVGQSEIPDAWIILACRAPHLVPPHVMDAMRDRWVDVPVTLWPALKAARLRLPLASPESNGGVA
jgi:hypothetical protein